MAATLNITINMTGTIQNLNDINFPTLSTGVTTGGNNTLNQLIDYLGALSAGTQNGTIIATTRDTDPSVATSGTGSRQITINKT